LAARREGSISVRSPVDHRHRIREENARLKSQGAKFYLRRGTDDHCFLVLASVSGYSQTHWTRKRVLIVRQKRNLSGQNVRREQTSK